MSIQSEKFKGTKNPRRERLKAFKKYMKTSSYNPHPNAAYHLGEGRVGAGGIPSMDELTDEQWALVAPLLPAMNTPRQAVGVLRPFPQGCFEIDKLRDRETPTYPPLDSSTGSELDARNAKHGRPAANARKVLNGILFYIRNALTWADIPPEYPSYITLFRRYHEWSDSGVLEQVIFALTRHLGERSGLDYEKALSTKTLSFHQQDGTLTIYLPPQYSEYWMQPTASLLLMWMVTRTLELYGEAYRRACKQRNTDRLPGQPGPRKSRPQFVEVVVGPNPHKKKVDKPNLAHERMEFMDRMSR
ncbi:MAG: hypothetical protein C0391_00505 [Anaerolinea sp.]|nr:hypothetical protein [Anaerolinea sp.]